jgi:hypothetical protein
VVVIKARPKSTGTVEATMTVNTIHRSDDSWLVVGILICLLSLSLVFLWLPSLGQADDAADNAIDRRIHVVRPFKLRRVEA